MTAKETVWYAKVLATITVVYALSPIDLIPDFIPVLGYLDDVIILPLLIALTVKCIPKETFDYYRKQAEGMWKNGEPKKMVLFNSDNRILVTYSVFDIKCFK